MGAPFSASMAWSSMVFWRRAAAGQLRNDVLQLRHQAHLLRDRHLRVLLHQQHTVNRSSLFVCRFCQPEVGSEDIV